MRRETIAIHSGYDVDPTTKSVAVPIYQTVAYAFDSADHGAALFNLEVEGYRYSRISNPTTAVLERRVAARAGGAGRPCVGAGGDGGPFSGGHPPPPGRHTFFLPPPARPHDHPPPPPLP